MYPPTKDYIVELKIRQWCRCITGSHWGILKRSPNNPSWIRRGASLPVEMGESGKKRERTEQKEETAWCGKYKVLDRSMDVSFSNSCMSSRCSMNLLNVSVVLLFARTGPAGGGNFTLVVVFSLRSTYAYYSTKAHYNRNMLAA